MSLVSILIRIDVNKNKRQDHAIRIQDFSPLFEVLGAYKGGGGVGGGGFLTPKTRHP